MEDNEFLTLSQLFTSLGIIEKGIEKIYHYLLLNNKIEKLQDVCNEFDLTLKRGYKICSVLSDLGLVQIYDRPMKIHIIMPLLPIWQKLVNQHIENLRSQFQEDTQKCETSLEDFFKNYNIVEEDIQEPVEFISFDVKSFDEMYYPLTAKTNCKIAIGIRYENPLVSLIHKSHKDVPNKYWDSLSVGMKKIKDNLANIEVQVIIHSELLSGLLNSVEFKAISQHISKLEPAITIKSIKIHITEEPFSNFWLIEDELIQPSFDPTNKLIGLYISRNKNIYKIFDDKFIEIFNKGVPINEYLKKVPLDSLTDDQLLALCLL